MPPPSLPWRYASRLDDTFRIAGTFVGRILGGAKPADLPVKQPMRYELPVNARTARALGIAIPAALRASAEVVEEREPATDRPGSGRHAPARGAGRC
jgi:putative ABC transport system substrate-binding protein